MDDTATARTWRTTLRRRLLFTVAVFVLWAVAIETRLVYLQVYQYDGLVARARSQRGEAPRPDPAVRRGAPLPRRSPVIPVARPRGRTGTARQVTSMVRRVAGRNAWHRLAPAARTIRAFRIWVNRELDGWETFLRQG